MINWIKCKLGLHNWVLCKKQLHFADCPRDYYCKNCKNLKLWFGGDYHTKNLHGQKMLAGKEEAE